MAVKPEESEKSEEADFTPLRPPTLLALPSYLAGHVARIGHRALVEALKEYDLRLPHFAVLVGLGDFGPLPSTNWPTASASTAAIWSVTSTRSRRSGSYAVNATRATAAASGSPSPRRERSGWAS